MPRESLHKDETVYWSRSSYIIPSSPQDLVDAEHSLMTNVKAPHTKKYVDLGKKRKIWTYIFNENSNNNTPLVLIHGFGGGIGFWCLNFESLSKNRTLYAFDLLGFARSSRYNFSNHSINVENEFVTAIDDWRNENGIDRMILLGHSFGGYLASCYALQHPEGIQHLILVDPWGFPEYVEDDPDRRRFPWWVKIIARIVSLGNPLCAVRCLGPCGPRVIKKMRADLGEKFEKAGCTRHAALNYIYHCNAQNPTGESAFKRITTQIAYAKHPMIKRISALDAGLQVSFIYGENTWMDKKCGDQTKEILSENPVEIYSIDDAGHHVYADQADEFNHIVNLICDHSEKD